jgi:hypothetical protein
VDYGFAILDGLPDRVGVTHVAGSPFGNPGLGRRLGATERSDLSSGVA